MTKELLDKRLMGNVAVTQQQYQTLSGFLNELLRWNKKVNLTSVTELEVCWEKHILDSLLVSPLLADTDSVLDVGSGAGFPSIPLSIIMPQLSICSVDTVGKKISFQRHCARKFQLTNFNAVSTRIESLYEEQGGGVYDVVTSRAFASLGKFVQLCSPYMKKDGRLLAMKGAGYLDEIDEAQEIMKKQGLTVDNIVETTLLPSGAKRAFIVIKRDITI